MAEIALTAVINKAIHISSNALFNEVSSASSLQENIDNGCMLLEPKWLCKVGPSTRRLAVSGASRETIDVLNNKNNVNFKKLENLRLSNDATHVISSGSFNMSGYPNLLKMHLDVFFSPSKLPRSEHFPPNLIKLTLLKNRLKADPLRTLNKLPKLKILKLDFDCYIGKTMDCDAGFCQLEVLRIRGLDNLEELMKDG
ncbi:hypothetical protein RND71_033700 [Anisodus tanguticus]|uniref:Uncharacterized protein n=1 Tax=Anisodus tanguticus TaxID=243964 RepID=A0AAE1R9U2_9SOLA|nr:hypothetical protein RND71_033700 [Anisodus tanguticus]